MKILTKEEEEAHYNATVKGGLVGGGIGLAAGLAGVTLGSLRFPIIRHLTLPMKAFLVTSTGTFTAITSADSSSRKFEQSRHPEEKYRDDSAKLLASRRENQSTSERLTQWAREHRYHIVGGSWVASMGIAFGLVSRSPLSTAQKLVQARVYAQGITVAVLIATAAFEVNDQRNDKGRYETIQTFDPDDPTHTKMVEKKVHKEEYEGEDQWKDMIASEEERLKRRERDVKEYEALHHKGSPKKAKEGEHHDKQKDRKEDEKGGGKEDQKDGQKDDGKDDKKEDKKEDKKDSQKDDSKDDKKGDKKEDSRNDKKAKKS